MIKIIKFCNKFFYGNRILLFLYVFITIVISFIGIIIPYILGVLIDQLSIDASNSSIYKFCLIFFSINIIKIIFTYINSVLYVKVQIKAAFNMNAHILNHIKKISMSFFHDKDISYLNQQINNDSNSLTIFTINILSDILTNSVTLIFVISILWKINSSIFYIILILIISYLLLYLGVKKIMYKYNYIFKESQSTFFSKLQEQLYNIKFIKIHSIFDFFENRLYDSYLDLINIAIKNNMVNYGFKSLESLITLSSQCMLIFLGALSVLKGNITIGFFTIISNYFFMSLNSFKYFMSLAQNYQNTLVSYNRIIAILNINEQTNGTKIIDKIERIELKNINFKYRNELVLCNFNYTFECGKIYCIVGENGSGKSTLVDILLGLYINEFTGKITYNDYDIHDINLYYLRESKVGVIEQEPLLISDTIINNIRLNNINIDEKRVKELLELFNLSIDKNKVVQDKGENLSGGEKQKLSIIRELLKDPCLIIFDEPTSALDKESKLKFYNLISEIKKDKSKIIIIITHDSELINLTNNIININYGGVYNGMD